MQILAIDLENTKSYEAARVEFTQGVNAIVGQNGAGKSTILEAIGFAIFDAIEYRQSDFVRDGAKTATVTITFLSSEDERTYQVVRRFGSSNQHYIYDPELSLRICEGKADVLSFLRQHLGVEPNTDLTALFRDAVGVAQGTFTAAFLETPARRKPIFDSLLHVEEYQDAYAKLLEPLKVLRDHKQEIQVEMAGLDARLEALPELETAVTQQSHELRQTTAKIDATTSQLTQVQGRRRDMESRQVRVTTLQAEHQQASQKSQNLGTRTAAAEKALDEAAASQKIVTQSQPGYAAYQEAQAQRTELEQKARQRQALDTQRAALDKAIALQHAEQHKLEEALKSIAEAEALAQELRPLVDQQSALEQALTAARQQQARWDDALKEQSRQDEQVRRLVKRREELTQQRRAEPSWKKSARQLKKRSVKSGCWWMPSANWRPSTGSRAKPRPRRHASCRASRRRFVRCVRDRLVMTIEHTCWRGNEDQLRDLRSAYAAAQKTVKQEEERLRNRQAALTRIQRELQNMPRPEESTKLDEEIELGRAAWREISARTEELAGATADVERVRAALQALNDLRQRFGVAMERAGHRSAAESQLSQGISRLSTLEGELTALQTEFAQYAGIDEALEATSRATAQHLPAYQTYLSHVRIAETRAQRDNDLENCRREAEQAEQEVAALAVELAAAQTAFDAAAYAQAVTDEQELRGQLGGLQNQAEMLGRSLAQAQSKIGELQQFQVQLRRLTGRQAGLALQENALDSIRNYLRQAGPYITSALIRRISDGARQIFSELLQDFSRHLAWNQEYGITLEVDGHERQFAQLSGGEQMSAALAVRLALLREMSSINVAFFDEPTVNLDEDRREALARQITQIRGFRQIFVISHDDTFEQSTQNLIRVERVNGLSRVTYG